MFENLNQIIAINLNHIAEDEYQTHHGDFIDINNERIKDSDKSIRLGDILNEKGLIEKSYETFHNEKIVIFKLTNHGREIHNNGGWLEHLEQKKEAEAKEQEQQQKAKKKERNEYTLVKWQKIVFWPVFIFGIFGGAYGLYDIVFPKEKSQEKIFSEEMLNSKLDSLKNALILEVKAEENKSEPDSIPK